MKLHVLFIIGFALSMTGCESKEQTAPEPAPGTTAPAAESMPAEKESYHYEGILRHMHAHADRIDLLNDALADGDLEGSKIPARWLWRHDTMVGVPDAWQPYMARMREAAHDVDSATDLETARDAAARITKHCQDCHAAVGINDESAEEQ